MCASGWAYCVKACSKIIFFLIFFLKNLVRKGKYFQININTASCGYPMVIFSHCCAVEKMCTNCHGFAMVPPFFLKKKKIRLPPPVAVAKPWLNLATALQRQSAVYFASAIPLAKAHISTSDGVLKCI